MVTEDNIMLDQVMSLPDLMSDIYPDLENQVRYILETPEIFSIKKIILTSCGDGYAACLATKRAFEQFLAIPIEVVDPLDLARLYQTKWVGETPCDPLVIALSNSGRVTRVVEAIERMKRHHVMTLAITSNSDSMLAQAADKVITTRFAPFPHCPGVRTYAVQLLALYLIAIRFGEVRLRYTMDEANLYRQELRGLLAATLSAPTEFIQKMERIALANRETNSVEWIASGADQGTAQYAVYKCYEAIGIPASSVNSETWFHINYFLKGMKQTLIVVFDSLHNPCSSRTHELIARLKQMEIPFVLVTNDVTLDAQYRVLLPESDCDIFMPMASFVVPAVLSSFLAKLSNEPYQRGFLDIWSEGDAVASSSESEIIIWD